MKPLITILDARVVMMLLLLLCFFPPFFPWLLNLLNRKTGVKGLELVE